MRHILSILVENEAGALSRVAGLFSARGYNIETLTVAPTEDSTLSRMTIVTTGSDEVVEQITKQLNKLADIFRGRILDVSEKSYTIELTGTTDKLDAFLETLDRGSILETVRTGVCGIGRGEWVLKV